LKQKVKIEMVVEACEIQHMFCPQCGDPLYLRVWVNKEQRLKKVFVCSSCPYVKDKSNI